MYLCEQVMICPFLDKELINAASIIYDSLYLIYKKTKQRYILFNKCQYENVICPLTLPPLYQYIINCSFVSSLAAIKEPIIRILSKVLNIVCQKRSWMKIMTDVISEDVSICQIINQIVLCSWLGAFNHNCPSSRPINELRYLCYEFWSSKNFTLSTVYWTLAWIQYAPWIIKTALRDYLVFMLQYNPILVEHINELMKFDLYQNIVIADSINMRKFIQYNYNINNENFIKYMYSLQKNVNIISSQSPETLEQLLNKQIRNSQNTYRSHVIALQIRALYNNPLWKIFDNEYFNQYVIKKSDSAIVDISYRLPRKCIADLLLSLHKSYPLHLRPGYEDPIIIQNKMIENNNNNNNDNNNKTKKQQQQQKYITPLTFTGHETYNNDFDQIDSDEILQTQLKVDHVLNLCLDYIDHYITEEQGIYLKKLANYAASHSILLNNNVHIVSALLKMINYWYCFNITDKQINKIRTWVQQYYLGIMSTEYLIIVIQNLRNEEPFLYNIFLLSVELLRDGSRLNYILPLPWHITSSQIISHLEHFSYKKSWTQNNLINDEPIIIDKLFEFVYCKICSRIYSFVRDIQTQYRRVYDHLLRGAIVEYRTNQCYCFRNIKNRFGQCNEQPLQRISLLGQVLHFNNRRYMICPQPNCARIMRLKSNKTIWTERGPSCTICTSEIQIQQLNSLNTIESLLLEQQKEENKQFIINDKEEKKENQEELNKYSSIIAYCCLCKRFNSTINRNKPITLQYHWFPFNIFLCRRHFTSYNMIEIIEKLKEDSLNGIIEQEEFNPQTIIDTLERIYIYDREQRRENSNNYYINKKLKSLKH